MSDLKLKFNISFINHKEGVVLLKNMIGDLYLMFLNYHHHLSMIEFEVGYVYQVIDENYNLDI